MFLSVDALKVVAFGFYLRADDDAAALKQFLIMISNRHTSTAMPGKKQS